VPQRLKQLSDPPDAARQSVSAGQIAQLETFDVVGVALRQMPTAQAHVPLPSFGQLSLETQATHIAPQKALLQSLRLVQGWLPGVARLIRVVSGWCVWSGLCVDRRKRSGAALRP